jgi:TolB-like protein/DNA-binding winged helix-turn-helix (wHTH) protein/Tfp pilus assembly protein PilF
MPWLTRTNLPCKASLDLSARILDMVSSPLATGTVRFGVFELDCQTGELRKQGVKVRLQGQPIEVLKRLLENPGELVTREDLRKRLWPADTFVDFDQALNNSVQRIREALGDSAQSPRFIETIPKRGYRFVGSASSPQAEPATRSRTEKPKKSHRTAYLTFAALLILAGVGMVMLVLRWQQNRRLQQIRTMAVLPLENLSGDPTQEYFADGITDELITEVAHLHPLRVISRTSVMRYKGTRKPLPEIARELGVDAVLEGSVTRSGSQVRVTAQLIEARTDTHLWSGEYAREMRDIISLQREVAGDIAHQIRLHLLPEQQTRITTASPVDPEAHELFLRGLHFWDQRTPESMAQATKYFNDSINREPGFAPAWAYLSTSYCISNLLNVDDPKAEYPKAVVAAQRALQLDPGSAEAHTAMACTRNVFEWNFEQGEAELRKAIELDPSYALAHQWYAWALLRTGQPEQSIDEMSLALRNDPLSLRTNLTYVGHLLGARKYEGAIEQAVQVVELYPENVAIHRLLAEAYEHAGKPDKAKQEFDKFLAGDETARSLSKPSQRLNYLQCKQQFNKIEAEKQLLDLEQKRKKGYYASPADFALAYLRLGNRRQAIRWLESAYEHRCSIVLSLALPQFDELRSEPAFQALTAKVGLPRAVR